MKKAINVIWTCNTTRGYSRFELLNWVNYTLCVDLIKIEEMCSGAGYCQLFDMLFNNVLPINKVKFSTNLEYQYINNFKLLQDAFKKVNVSKEIPINDLVKSRFQANFEFLQWFHKFFEANREDCTLVDYDPIQKRNGCSIVTGLSKQADKIKCKVTETHSNQTFTICVGSRSSEDSDALSETSQSMKLTNEGKPYVKPSKKPIIANENLKHLTVSNPSIKKKRLKKGNKKRSSLGSTAGTGSNVKKSKSFVIRKASNVSNTSLKNSVNDGNGDVKENKSFVIENTSAVSSIDLKSNAIENKSIDVKKNDSSVIEKASDVSNIAPEDSVKGVSVAVKNNESYVIKKASIDFDSINNMIKTIDQIIENVHIQTHENRFLKRQRDVNFTRLCYLERHCHTNINRNISHQILDIIYKSDKGADTPGVIPKGYKM
ncbi:microtubule-associated protein RP/EB family member 2-like isoform X1 [Teleopsis dalmanni]|uniref:microtubule-associated protein RP/EB family member 2-like isoform X1 n=1 Tax=Teleopsis dalmanni TaxID=139649 RepID=UPI0018CD5FB4|nr:microtubule-associated protein RP/EB family member 2-like isoform X1 [Teleopsis dalmanni]